MIPLHDTAPRRYPPVMTWALIGANTLIFFFELSLSRHQLEALFYLFGIVPARYGHPAWGHLVGLPAADYWPFLTSMFLHGGWLHLIGNMWILWIFGDNVEDRMGPWRFLIFYLLCGLAAGLVHVSLNLNSTVPTVGASGAIAGVLGAYFVLYPRSQVIVLLPIFFFPFFFALPAALFLLLWFFLQFFSGALALVGPKSVGGVAWWAHVGGFVAGALCYRLFLDPGRRSRFFPDELDYPNVWGRRI